VPRARRIIRGYLEPRRLEGCQPQNGAGAGPARAPSEPAGRPHALVSAVRARRSRSAALRRPRGLRRRYLSNTAPVSLIVAVRRGPFGTASRAEPPPRREAYKSGFARIKSDRGVEDPDRRARRAASPTGRPSPAGSRHWADRPAGPGGAHSAEHSHPLRSHASPLSNTARPPLHFPSARRLARLLITSRRGGGGGRRPPIRGSAR
jgi:hypothetical protein